MQNLSLEKQLLINITRLNLSKRNIQNIQILLQNNLDWDYILKAGQQNEVAGLLFFHLKGFKEQVPAKIMEQLSKIAHMIGFYNLNYLQELNKIFDYLKEKQIDALVFKGAFLLENVFNDLTLRSMGDLDILIHKDDFPQVDDMLAGLEYFPLQTEYPKESFGVLRNISYLKKDLGLRVDLHWHLIEINSPYSMELEGLWARARTATVAEHNVSILSVEDLLIFICLHGVYNHYMTVGLKCFCDLGEIIHRYRDEINWPDLVERAIKSRMAFVVYAGLFLTEMIFPEEIPQNVLKELALHCSKGQLIWLNETGETWLVASNVKTMETLIRLRMLNGVWGKSRLILSIFFPPVNQLAYQYSYPLNSLLGYVMHWPQYLANCLVKLAGKMR